jgi:Polyketide cyclase / dehydrase and lipid transport
VASVEVSEQVAASPHQVWQLVRDPVEMTGFTAECIEMQWIDGSSGPAVGATFRGRNRSGWRRWSTTCTIVRYEPGAAIAWDVSFGPLAVARWSYLVEPGASAAVTTLRERFDDHRGPTLRAVGPLVRGTRDAEGRNRANMTATLARIKGRAEA